MNMDIMMRSKFLEKIFHLPYSLEMTLMLLLLLLLLPPCVVVPQSCLTAWIFTHAT